MKTLSIEVELKKLPDIPGLVFRGFRGEEDYPGMLAAYLAAMKADGVEASDTLEQLAYNYNHLVRCDPYTDMLIAELDGEIIAYGRTGWNAELNNNHIYYFFVHLKPEWRGTGVGIYMAEWLINRAKEIARDHPADAPKYLQVWSSDRQKWQSRMSEDLGMKPVRYGSEMTRLCSEPVEVHPLPDGIEVRPITPDLMRAVWEAEAEAEAEAFRDHWGYVEPTEENYQAWLNWPLQSPELWKVAFDGDQVVGMVRNFINHEENREYKRKRGYTEDISVRRPWRRKGIARALLTDSIQMFIEMGMEETCLGVDTENPNGALALYTGVGYQKIHTGITYRKPMEKL
ncbi:MAG: GNAT family N-acetyltransferase [Anaerolineales bacterium]|nr:GNAT family N-acetyltransferase [Anaerolineales bacterium]